ncbi:hypothetical protein F2P79_011511 [Pimephales promelas]|nr:hypothetical protein F2P79_011511 [Pimephales promelas]
MFADEGIVFSPARGLFVLRTSSHHHKKSPPYRIHHTPSDLQRELHFSSSEGNKLRSMVSFVIDRTEWQLTDLVERFQEEGTDEESFLLLEEATINS